MRGALCLLLLQLAIPAVARAANCRDPGADCSLREAADQVGVGIGAAAQPGFIAGDPNYGPVLAREFNSLTAENHMKWAAVQPALGVYDFTAADALVDFAELNGMAVRGHNLIWDQELVDSTPAYVSSITDPNELRSLLAEHIQTVVGRYKGRVDAWDVVNEPLVLGGTELYENIFFQLLGPGYIAEALELAHAADPNATLFINEVLVSLQGARFDAFLALAADLLSQGAPLHGVGIQGHYFGPPDPVQLEANIRALEELGLVVEITELDILLSGNDDPNQKLERQRTGYFNVVSACMAVTGCRRVTTWGFSDRYTWIDGFVGPQFDPLPFDEDYGRKPAYFGVREALLTRSIPVLPPGVLGLAAILFVLLGLHRLAPAPGRYISAKSVRPLSGSLGSHGRTGPVASERSTGEGSVAQNNVGPQICSNHTRASWVAATAELPLN